ncbi:mitochondrial cytochrome c oxidase assembly factor [Histoplasma capsulatum var. duboisii H88]|uniref:Mitochondrial cytochrome c oxidase assembly factor n=3 Tax=Ajellomyces capsulatus TaxID=5037 RepID=C0NHI2_AJECG|nr:mitochondrial cytochrome c oxidase assembly factor [Histoplasma capsulatum G186AR]EEH09267.1 mitochondrial cytochrome c oxidase assembly factor [Histoplasma capsulatum G186AR]EER43959.1 mitochondrial cytochrome c oxidase assembly factor [Histoplasma capsulatum H143]EGC49785.1 mitochondrial cytochrome c oxidase assembly factor [Histoplasma capsulatum var. duboisii H88]QSS51000.1 mitochondrial cytochrome c oxidase assembly factor [Histoplasma capsulatum var. duboisii H88]
MFNAVLRRLQGGNLEVFKFGVYVLFPIGWMYYFGTNLEERFSVPGFWPTKEQSHKIPLELGEIEKELARMDRQKALRAARLREQGAGSGSGSGNGSAAEDS